MDSLITITARWPDNVNYYRAGPPRVDWVALRAFADSEDIEYRAFSYWTPDHNEDARRTHRTLMRMDSPLWLSILCMRYPNLVFELFEDPV